MDAARVDERGVVTAAFGKGLGGQIDIEARRVAKANLLKIWIYATSPRTKPAPVFSTIRRTEPVRLWTRFVIVAGVSREQTFYLGLLMGFLRCAMVMPY